MNRREILIASAAAATITLPRPGWAAAPADFPYTKKTKTVGGHAMAYVDEGAGTPVVFLHGNPTSSYLWRNIFPAAAGHRVIAPDLIGMGDSDQPELAYTYADHAEHLHGLLDKMNLRDAVLVLHDWGSALGFDWAEKNRDRVRGIAFMEAILPPVMPFASYEAMGPFADLFRMLRSEAGAQAVLGQNFFVEEILAKMAVAQPLSEEVLAHYRKPFPTPESRLPTLQWPREIPVGGMPPQTTAVVERYSAWFLDSDLPKLMIHAEPGALIPPEAATWLKGRLSNLTSVNIGRGVHFLQEDNPSSVARALNAWLATL